MKIIAALLVFLLIAPNVFAAGKNSKKKKTKQVAATWIPVAFDETVERLPAGYKGLDSKQFYKMFSEKTDKLRKGEFENSEQFAIRTANKIDQIAPINTVDLYAFSISAFNNSEFNINAKRIERYDADAQAYILGVGFYTCKSGYSKDITCQVGHINFEYETYVGGNAFGASVEVTRSRSTVFSLAIQNDSTFSKTMFSSKEVGGIDRYYFIDKIPISSDKARSLKDKHISVLFVGRVTGAEMVSGRGFSQSASIDSPSDIFISEAAVPFEIKKIIYYVFETGEIVHQRSF